MRLSDSFFNMLIAHEYTLFSAADAYKMLRHPSTSSSLTTNHLLKLSRSLERIAYQLSDIANTISEIETTFSQINNTLK